MAKRRLFGFFSVPAFVYFVCFVVNEENTCPTAVFYRREQRKTEPLLSIRI